MAIHLRINNSEGRIIGILDIDDDKVIPKDSEELSEFKNNLQKSVQNHYEFPVTVDMDDLT